jgi:hypothetical protein
MNPEAIANKTTNARTTESFAEKRLDRHINQTCGALEIEVETSTSGHDHLQKQQKE